METQKREFVKIELTERMKEMLEVVKSNKNYDKELYAAHLFTNLFLNQLACQEKAPWNE